MSGGFGGYVRIPGFYPLNGYIWTGQDEAGRDNTNGTPLWRIRLWMLVLHAKRPRVLIRTITAWRVNRTPGPRWKYPWQ